jgi:hypothetical protein
MAAASDKRLSGKVAIVTGAGSRRRHRQRTGGFGPAGAAGRPRHSYRHGEGLGRGHFADDRLGRRRGHCRARGRDKARGLRRRGAADGGALGPARHPREQCRHRRAAGHRGRGGSPGVGRGDARQRHLDDADGEIRDPGDAQGGRGSIINIARSLASPAATPRSSTPRRKAPSSR